MTRTLAPMLSICAFGCALVVLAQNGPDNDANAAPGYAKSVFDLGQVDSINLYNGLLTIPIAIGPSYPVGPRLRVQAAISYNSRVTDYGAPTAPWQSPDFSYRPLVGNPSLGVGWELTLGAIKSCKHGNLAGSCYFAPDGSQHMFDVGAKTGDGGQFFLQGTGPYDMWDGDGNHHVFGWHVSGYDDIGLPEGYTHDFGRGRDGWYLTSVTDPYGNSYSIGYYDRVTVPTPLWTYGTSTCSLGTVEASIRMRNPSAANTWIPKDITLPSGSKVQFHTGTVNGVTGMITSVDFPEFVDGASVSRTWTLVYEGTFLVLNHPCSTLPHALPVNLQRLKALQLPSDLSGSPSYQFSYGSSILPLGLLEQITLPTGGSIAYCYNTYTLFHARAGALEPGCAGFAPNTTDAVVTKVSTCSPSTPVEPEPRIPGPCNRDNDATYSDFVTGVIRRREILGAVQNDTNYVQYGFPFGEAGTSTDPDPAQSLTVVIFPPTDTATPGAPDAGRRRAKAVLFDSAPSTYLGPGPMPPSRPGDRVGQDLEERVFETDPAAGTIADPPCSGNPATDSAFCGSKALRVSQKTYEYDTSGVVGGNRRVIQEKTIHGPSTCATCPYHQVSFTNTGGDTWEDNGRHYDVETHTGTLGGDSRTITTDWAPVNWGSNPSSLTVLPNVLNRRTAAQGSSVRDEYFEFETAIPNGFLKGSFVYDSVKDIAFIHCRYNDGAGNVDKEFTKTLNSGSAPARMYCSGNYPNFPSSVGTDGDMFGQDYSWQHGELLTARSINGAVGTSTFNIRDYTRDPTTGWLTASRDTSGRQTSYTYDSLGRVNQLTPPSSDLKTWVCYESSTATTAYRASTRQVCPVAPSNASISTWQHFDYDGLGRLVREKRLQPSSAVEKRFALFDGAGSVSFTSEWVTDATSEAIATDLSTACVFSGGNFNGRGRPSSAPGTYRMCFDPFGRPQQIVGAKHSSLVTVDRTDGSGNIYSDTREAALTYCVNATFSNLGSATCNSGGINSTTTAQKDAYGRIVSVTEPSGDVTTYAYDVNARLTTVNQGAQSRTFSFDTNGFLRSETTPERGTVTYNAIGSLGNVRTETQPGSLVLSRTFDFAGRLTQEGTASGTTYAVNCYDGASTCVDGSPGSAGGPYPGGKLTRRYGYNWIPTLGPIVDEQFTYGDAGGRLSQLATTVGNGDFASSTIQSWTYSNLGLVATHNHPRNGGAFPVAYGYTNGFPTSISANGINVVTAATYNPAAGLASWTAGTSGAGTVTTIVQDATRLPRPANISNPLWSSGAFTYDGAGNILKMGSSDLFAYDARSRLFSATYSSVPRAFAYDRYGNLTQNGATGWTIDPATNRLKPVSFGAPAYDARGNLVSYNGTTTSYDLLDRQYRNSSSGSDWVSIFNGVGERLVKFSAKFTVLRREMARYIAEANILAKGWALPTCVQVFSDVPCSDPDARYIKLVYDKGVTAGCATNPLRYCPDQSLSRAQMAVFLVKGYKPDGFAPPACQGTFQDVSCSGGYATFAPWIEQLYRDGVTAGCNTSPLQFCPGNTVGEWEMMVWLANAPGSTPGSAFWSAYHPVPRGAIYTWRDEANRVVTESAGGTSGAGTASLSVARDNVFLGNLLVASYVASPAGWQYTASDHLGSPRVVFNSSGQLLESHKHWPYGEDTNPVPPSQRLSYALMERDSDGPRYYDHARSHDYGLGRFLCPDAVSGTPANPQTWNRYAYTLGNPMKYVDPDGNVAVGFTGMFNSPNSGVHQIASLFARHPFIGPSRVFRHQDTKKAFAFVMSQLQANRDQPVVIFGHSRGAASSLKLARELKQAGVKVDLLLTLDPVMMDPALNQRVPSNVTLAVNYFENLSSPLEGLYLTGDPDTTEIENRHVLGTHGIVDDLVAGATKDFESLVSRVSEMLRQAEAARRAKGLCDRQGRPCPEQ